MYSNNIIRIHSMDTSKYKYYEIYNDSFKLDDIYTILRKNTLALTFLLSSIMEIALPTETI